MQAALIKYSTACSFQPAQKDSAGFPWCHAPKASSAFSFFSCLTSLLFSAEKNTHKNNQQNLCMLQAGAWSHGEVSGHHQATVSRKETVFYFYLRKNCITSIIAHHPKCYQAGQAGLCTKLCEQKVFFSSTTKKERQTSHILRGWALCSW